MTTGVVDGRKSNEAITVYLNEAKHTFKHQTVILSVSTSPIISASINQLVSQLVKITAT